MMAMTKRSLDAGAANSFGFCDGCGKYHWIDEPCSAGITRQQMAVRATVRQLLVSLEASLVTLGIVTTSGVLSDDQGNTVAAAQSDVKSATTLLRSILD